MKTPNIYTDLEQNNYIIFRNKKAKQLKNYYPTISNNYPGVSIKELNIHDLITIKMFVAKGDGEDIPNIIEDYIDLTVESIDGEIIVAKIISPLPEDFVFKTGASIELKEEEILYCVPVGDSLKGRTLN